MKCFKGSRDYDFKHKKFLHNRSGNRKFWKRYARKLVRNGLENTLKYRRVCFLIYEP